MDKGAANRFIKHAITQVKHQQQQDQHITFEPTQAVGTSTAAPLPVKTTSKMLARAQYEQELKETPSDEEDDELEVFDEMEPEQDPENPDYKGKGKAPSVDGEPQSGKKRRRPATDPFTGRIFTFPNQLLV